MEVTQIDDQSMHLSFDVQLMLCSKSPLIQLREAHQPDSAILLNYKSGETFIFLDMLSDST